MKLSGRRPFQVQTITNAKSLRHQLGLGGSRAESQGKSCRREYGEKENGENSDCVYIEATVIALVFTLSMIRILNKGGI